MHIEVITKDDLHQLKQEIINSLTSLVQEKNNHTQWLKSAQVREMLTISAGTLQSYREKGILPYTRISETIFYDRNDIEQILKDNKVA